MCNEIAERENAYFCPTSYSWIIRKQFNYSGKNEYMIELVELEGCVSYGETIAEAKQGLKESIKLWFKHHGNKKPSILKTTKQLVHIEPNMTKEEFKKLNNRLLQLIN